MRYFRRRRYYRRQRRRTKNDIYQYNLHKECARALVHRRLEHWNQFYNFTYKRVSIKDTSSRWGSCSDLGNLNFNYRIVFLPIELVDYLIVHELCHLGELNHSKSFWELVSRAVPEYRTHEATLRTVGIDSYTPGKLGYNATHIHW